MVWYPVTCVYCGRRTGAAFEPLRKIVCYGCQWDVQRDERLEVAAGMRPWARPLSFWAGYFGWKALSDAEAAMEQAKWERRQAEAVAGEFRCETGCTKKG